MSDDSAVPDWMRPMDQRILRLLYETRSARLPSLWLKPSTIATNLDANRPYVTDRLNSLEAADLVERDDVGYARLTEDGVAFVEQSGDD